MYQLIAETLWSILEKLVEVEILEKIVKMYRFKKNLLLYSYNNISKKIKKLVVWIRIKDIGGELDVRNTFDLVDKEIKDKYETNYPPQ